MSDSSWGEKGLCGFLGKLGGKEEGCVLLKEGPLGSSDTRLPPTGKKLYDIHLLGCVGGTPLGTFIWIHLN